MVRGCQGNRRRGSAFPPPLEAGRTEIGGVRRSAVSVLLSGVNVGVGSGWGPPGQRAGVLRVLQTATWVRAGRVCCGASRRSRPARSTVWAAATTVRVWLMLSLHAPIWQIRRICSLSQSCALKKAEPARGTKKVYEKSKMKKSCAQNFHYYIQPVVISTTHEEYV